MEETPKELDWVNERAKCDIKKAFELLGEAVKKDIEQYKNLTGLRTHYHADFLRDSEWLFSVSRRHNTPMFTAFNLKQDHIEITLQKRDSEQRLEAKPVFTETGFCKFSIDDNENGLLFQWQLRRHVLDLLMFGN